MPKRFLAITMVIFLVVDEMIESNRINGKLKKLPIFDFQAFKRG